MVTHYEVLGVAPGADTETIRRAYVMVAKATHPDRRQSEDPARSAQAEEHIRLANAAWNVLRDPQRRAEYDRSLRPASSTAGATEAATTGPASHSGIVGARPAPPPGFAVPAEHASIWRHAPVIVVLAVLVAILVFSAYATSNDPAARSAPQARQAVLGVDDCLLIVFQERGRAPAPVTCGTEGSYRVVSVVDTPRPCPTGSEQLPLSDQKTTLCLVVSA